MCDTRDLAMMCVESRGEMLVGGIRRERAERCAWKHPADIQEDEDDVCACIPEQALEYGIANYVASYLVDGRPQAAAERVNHFGRESAVVGDLVMNSEGSVKVLTEEDLEQFAIRDVVLPLPGYEIEWPTYQIGGVTLKDFYTTLMQADSLSFEDLKSTSNTEYVLTMCLNACLQSGQI